MGYCCIPNKIFILLLRLTKIIMPILLFKYVLECCKQKPFFMARDSGKMYANVGKSQKGRFLTKFNGKWRLVRIGIVYYCIPNKNCILRLTFTNIVMSISLFNCVYVTLYGGLPKLSDKIAARKLRLAVHCQRHPDLLAHRLILWEPTHG